MRLNRESDPRLLGGIVHRVGEWSGVLYNADGVQTEALATPHNTTVAVLTRNRASYLKDLLQSVEANLPSSVGRLILVNNTDDDSCSMLRRDFPSWRVEEVRASGFPKVSAGLAWLRDNRPTSLPPALFQDVAGYGPTDSIAWLKNWQLRECRTRFLISFDDDMLVKPGWLDYLLTFQNRFYAYAVINNFGAYLMDTAVVRKIGWFDERYLRSHGYEDNDYVLRMNEAKLRWVLGFNPNHDWRSAEEGNPRGSGTGCDLFVHRYAKREGGFSASLLEHAAAEKDAAHFGNWCWHRAKWTEVREGPGLQDRPPFKGSFSHRKESEEPDWYGKTRTGQRGTNLQNAPQAAAPGVKTTQNTPVDEIDPLANPATSTMIDRYALLSHWCKGRDVLDAGSGHGYGSALLYSLGAKSVLGIEREEDALRFAQGRYQREGLSFVKADLLDLSDTLKHRFDTVVCVEVFEHVSQEEALRLVRGLRQAVRDGGTILITTPRRKTRDWQGGKGTHLYEYSCREFKDALGPILGDADLRFFGITEFQIEGTPQWFSKWNDELDESATVMIALAQGVPERTRSMIPDVPAQNVRIEAGADCPRLSILISNRNTLAYLKLALKSCREYLLRPDHEIIVYDDASTDGSVEWLKENAQRYRMRVMFNPGPDRKGIVYAYDELVEAALEPVIFLVHSDMFFARHADAELWRHFGKGTVATCTRIEPPLHQEEPHRVLRDFGLDASSFREEEFLRFAEGLKDRRRVTTGVFAPIMAWREDYLSLGGHDKTFAPQSREDSDLFNRMSQAGFRFVQSWSAFCYHFSGRGSRRKDSPRVDSDEWRASNAKNERNFIRKWGTSVRHDPWLKPLVRRKRPLTLVGLLGNEKDNVIPWLGELEPYFDEIILVDDSEDGSAERARAYMADESATSPIAFPEKLRILKRRLNADYGGSRNAAQELVSFDWALHVDLDERLQRSLLEHLQELVDELEGTGKTVCGFPRVNILDGAVVNDVPRAEWTLERLRALAAGTSSQSKRLTNPDIQFRLVRREVRWTPGIHEVPEAVARIHRRESVSEVTTYPHAWIIHEKTLLRQAAQDARYRRIAGDHGPHAGWNPEGVLASLESSDEPSSEERKGP